MNLFYTIVVKVNYIKSKKELYINMQALGNKTFHARQIMLKLFKAVES